MRDLSHIKNVVFAGGGNRCFWQAGFWTRVANDTGLKPEQVVSVSAGSAISCAILAKRIPETLEMTTAAVRDNLKNQYWGNLLKADRVFPHEAIYRRIVRDVMDDDAWQYLQQGPRNAIQIARIPRWLGPRSATALGLLAYQLEKKLHQPVHPVAGRRLGFYSEFVTAQSCATREALTDLIIASSCTPPFTQLMVREQRPALDGGLVDNVPVHGVEQTDKPTLVLLTRPYKKLPQHPNRLYLQPSRPVPISAWDYTSPEGVKSTYQLGWQDGEQFLQSLR